MPERQPGLQGAAAAAPALLGSPDSASAAADAGGGGGGGGAISARSSCSAAWDALRMASPALAQQPPPQPQPQPALAEARRWIEQVTGKTFGDKHFRSGLENGVLLCELLNSILPGSVTKINRSSTPIAGLDNIALFLRGCREVGLKESQLFDPGDLQETTGRTTTKNLDGSRKLKNVLVTIYWLGKTANNSAHFNGPPLNLKEFEGLLTQMRKDTEDVESPKRSIRDSGYVDCWDSERSDSLSPPRHGRDDSFDSLDSFGSRSQQTPSPDVVLRGSSDGRGSDSESDLPHRKLPDVKKDDMSARRTSYSEPKSVVPFNQYLPNKSNQTAYIPAPLRKKKAEREDFRKSWSTMSSPLGGERPFRSGCRTPVSDDTESVSMFDMRCPDEGAVNQPHSKDRHEKLQIVHHQLKEDEDQWQDDLARWKNRRRSASQDLLKKEAERKKMEQLLIGGEGSNERRKSIKTYREIVEEKEKRERELHEAYKNARSQEEADRILQHYIERFTISEAVLERLEMPKLLERSHSVEPNSSSPSKDPNPLRYLRQQSLPPPKFTAKFEATIIPTNGSEASTSTGSPTSSRPSGSMAMPLVTPKPYSQPRETREILRNFKVDGKISVNGEASNGVDDEPDKDCSAFLFEPSPTLSTKSDHVVKSHGGSTEGSTNSTTPEPVQKSLIEHAVHREKVDSFTEEVDTACRKDRTELKEKFLVDPDLMEPSVTFSCANLLAADVEISSFHNHSNETESHPELNSTQEAKALERGEEKEKDASVSQKVQIDTSQAPKPGEDLPISLLKKLPETNHGVLLETPLQDQKAAAENRDASNRSTCWSWDPEEERRRQERWQQEQERLLQEKYQKEQEKLKKEWEKAQKEVEEEERKYYEEERKILEDTVVPFMLASGSTEPLSTSSSLTDGNRTMNLIDLSYSEDDKKPNEEAKLKSLFYEQDGANYKECQPREENTSTVNKEEYPEGLNWRQKEQVPTPGDKSPKDMALPLRPEVLWNQPLPADRSPGISDIRQKDSPVGYNLGQPASSPKEVKRAASQGSSGTGPSSPRSPTVQSQSSNRSISGKKLCSSCGLPLGKGAAMIIESLGLYFHIQCFRVGVSRPGGGLD
ncbi:LIM and calponin homology domains-containing protein 1 isoform X15 [Ahaetulla prasina]|uniref:LIM and calponin homology domains-containing protein 1 isoform X15 n=1 Tax=Ahaetulla prasina TaxID=499056 RepID=UPI0026489201|nr:LIM and calponin homology domains-containing protein 1 isoform X15 [Ahaetulla prasina]